MRGLCRARVARGGEVVDENYGRVTSIGLDPIEKKPLARFRPGTFVTSIGSYGCNLECPFCQNASIACAGPDEAKWLEVSPEAVVDLASRTRGSIGIAYTYNEPLVGYEFVRDTAALAHDAGLVNVLVTNGMVNEGPLSELLPLVDAANVDLKGFSQRAYEAVGGHLDAVERTIAAMAACPTCHLEVTTLVVEGLNDDAREIEAAAAWLASLDPSIAYHLARCFPCHRMAGARPTPVGVLEEMARAARRHLGDVVLGNC